MAAYESGSRQPTLPVLERMLNAAGFELSVDLVHRPELLRIADLGGLIRDEPDTDRRLRLYFEFLRGADEADDDLLLLLAAEPPTTGDRRYDALLAATAEHLAVHAGLPTPAWALQHDRVIDGFWWVSDLPSAVPKRWSTPPRHSAAAASSSLATTWRQHDFRTATRQAGSDLAGASRADDRR